MLEHTSEVTYANSDIAIVGIDAEITRLYRAHLPKYSIAPNSPAVLRQPRQILTTFKHPEAVLRAIQDKTINPSLVISECDFATNDCLSAADFLAEVARLSPQAKRVVIGNDSPQTWQSFNDAKAIANEAHVIGSEWLPDPENNSRLVIDRILNSSDPQLA